MSAKDLPRLFRYNNIELEDPGREHDAVDVRNLYAATYPEITSAAIEGPEQKDGKIVYTFRRAVGTKGAERVETTQRFHLGEILSITTGRLVSPSGVAGLYAILNFMTGAQLYTHQLPRAAQACKHPLLEQFPQLARVDATFPNEQTSAWLAARVKEHGEHFGVKPLPSGAYAKVDPIVELAHMTRRKVIGER